MLRTRESMSQELYLGREGTVDSSPWCLRPRLGRLEAWSRNHLGTGIPGGGGRGAGQAEGDPGDGWLK